MGKKAVCIIGGGLAGGIAASTLAARGYPVTLIELGNTPAPYHPEDEVWDESEIKTAYTRGSGLGGTSNFWHGGLTILDRSDVEGIPDLGNSARLPIGYDILRDYYSRAVELLRNGMDFSLAEIEAAPRSTIAAFPIAAGAFRPKALLYPNTPFSTEPVIRHARNAYGLRVATGVKIEKLVSTGRRVTRAEGTDLGNGASVRFSADIFILSAGGLGSPKILMNSFKECPPLEQLPVGCGLIDHPTGFVFKAKLRRRTDLQPLFGLTQKGYKLRYGFALQPAALREADYRNHILYLRPALSMRDPVIYDSLKRKLVGYRGRSLNPLDIFNLLRNADLLFDAVNFKYGLSYSTRYVSGLVFSEQFPRTESRMYKTAVGKFGVRWKVSNEDCRSLEKFLSIFFRDYSDIFDSFTIFPKTESRLDSAGHHSGSCRMAAEAPHGVVDANLRVFGLDNLFVVDGSVLAYSGHANTGLTIAALALKCCDALSED
jgi:choline dehydrogenase-like flavoprotein